MHEGDKYKCINSLLAQNKKKNLPSYRKEGYKKLNNEQHS